jgi:hypothetical protein
MNDRRRKTENLKIKVLKIKTLLLTVPLVALPCSWLLYFPPLTLLATMLTCRHVLVGWVNN